MELFVLISRFATASLAEQTLILSLFSAGVMIVFDKIRLADFIHNRFHWYCEFCLSFWLSFLIYSCFTGLIVLSLIIALAAAAGASALLKWIYS